MIFCDMDGVLVDMVGRVCERLGESKYYVDDYEMTRLGGWESALVQAGANSSSFWGGLSPLPGIGKLTAALHRYDPNWYICTTPYRYTHAGKILWIERHLHYMRGRIVFSDNKPRLMDQMHNSILIDDCEKNIRPGKDILYPQRWNSLRGVSDPVEYVIMELQSRLG